MINYSLILESNYSKKSCSLIGNSYEGLNWYDESPKPTKEELDSQWEDVLSIQKKLLCKSKAKQLLVQSDWSETPSVIDQLENANEWKQYRINIRKYIINPTENPTFPNKPETKWKQV